MNAARSFRSLAVLSLATLGLGACSVFSNPERDPQGIVNRKLTGMRLGEFIDQYGGPRVRDENTDGSVSLLWQSKLKLVAPGTTSPDDILCRLRITADRNGRIVTSDIATDTTGEKSTSKCVDIFR